MFTGVLESIHLVAVRGGEPTAVTSVRAVAGKGLEGDRYFGDPRGPKVIPADEREVTLVEVEAIEALARDHGIELVPGATRRNLVTRAVPLNHLVGRAFSIGEAVLEGQRLCDPCTRLAHHTSRSVMKAMVNRGGLRARVVIGGIVRVGDAIRPAVQVGFDP